MKRTIITTAVILTLLTVVSGQDVCPPLTTPNNGGIVLNQSVNQLGTIAKYFCDDGYVLDGDAIRCCVVGESMVKWMREDVPTCVQECPDDLMDPDHGYVVTTGNVPGDKAVYFCDDGFTLKGEKKIKCIDGGTWDGTPPTCEKRCPKLPHIPYGKVYTGGLKPGSTAIYHCKYGYYLNGYKKRICDEDGTWTYREPTCDKDYREKYAPWKKSYSSGSRRKSSRSYSSRSHKRYW